ncbi:MAG: hypothetical protein HYV63_25355 [Candidatus Schekmanbacteria bacterium]|nr:hypothetical protein [Candidatus Schekmanbacteria bacterium]
MSSGGRANSATAVGRPRFDDYRPGHYGNDESATAVESAVATLSIDSGYTRRLDVHAALAPGRGMLAVDCYAIIGERAMPVAVWPAPVVSLNDPNGNLSRLPGSVASCDFDPSFDSYPKRLALTNAATATVGIDRVVETVDWSGGVGQR